MARYLQPGDFPAFLLSEYLACLGRAWVDDPLILALNAGGGIYPPRCLSKASIACTVQKWSCSHLPREADQGNGHSVRALAAADLFLVCLLRENSTPLITRYWRCVQDSLHSRGSFLKRLAQADGAVAVLILLVIGEAR